MNKYSVSAVILAVLIGLGIGVAFMHTKTNKDVQELRDRHSKQLEIQKDSILQLVHRRDKKILDLENSIELDSIKITGLLHKIEQDGLKTDKRRLEAKKLTKDEKIDWINNRYKSIP